MLKLSSFAICPSPSNTSCLQFSEHDPIKLGKNVAKGTLILLVLVNSESYDPQGIAQKVVSKVSEDYFNASLDPLASLKGSLENAGSEFSQSSVNLEIVATAFSEGVIYSAVSKKGQVGILRGESFAKIITGVGQIVVASGYPEEGDLLILGTPKFFDEIPVSLIKSRKEDLVGLKQSLLSLISSKPDSSQIGAAILFFGDTTFEEKPLEERTIKLDKPKSLIFSETFSKFKTLTAKVLPKRQIYLKGEEDQERGRNKKTTITVGIILLMLLLISIGFGIKQRNTKLAKGKYQDRLDKAVQDFNEASSLTSLDEGRSRELFLSSSSLAQELNGEGVKDPVLLDLLKKIDSSRGTILKEYQDSLKNFVETSLLSDGFQGTDVSSSGEEMFILDKNSRKVIQVSLNNKKSKVVAGPEDFGSGSQIASFEDKFFVLEDNGVFQFVGEKKTVVEKDWTGEALLYSYAGNLYILDKAGSKIWRYPGVTSGFAGKQNWFGTGVAPDLSNVISWVIDGNVWLLSGSGKISKFSLGSPQGFSLTGLALPLNSPVSLYTNENLQDIYILDPKNTRMVVLDKKGVYKASYTTPELAGSTDLVVSENDKKAVFLVKGSLKYLDLKHL